MGISEWPLPAGTPSSFPLDLLLLVVDDERLVRSSDLLQSARLERRRFLERGRVGSVIPTGIGQGLQRDESRRRPKGEVEQAISLSSDIVL